MSLPTEADGVIGVTSVGPSGRKASYSDYGIEQADVAAPGGDSRDLFGTPQYRQGPNLILAAYPEAVGRTTDRNTNGTPDIDEAGNPTSPIVVRDGNAYYQRILRATARDTPCPEPRVLDHPDLGPEYTATCEGNPSLNGFYGDGIVDALGAVTTRR